MRGSQQRDSRGSEAGINKAAISVAAERGKQGLHRESRALGGAATFLSDFSAEGIFAP